MEEEELRFFVMLLSMFFSSVLCAEEVYVFVSFSMPEQLLIETLKESARLHVPATLNGLYQNSVEQTAQKVLLLTQALPQLQLQIDPTAFERFNIQQVPALVVANGDCFDVLYGNLSLSEGLSRIHDKGACVRRGVG